MTISVQLSSLLAASSFFILATEKINVKINFFKVFRFCEDVLVQQLKRVMAYAKYRQEVRLSSYC